MSTQVRPGRCLRCNGTWVMHLEEKCWCPTCMEKDEDARCGNVAYNPKQRRSSNPVRQQAATAVAALKAGTEAKSVFEAFVRRGTRGYTDDELVEVYGKASVLATRERLTEDHLLHDSYGRRIGDDGREMVVWTTAKP